MERVGTYFHEIKLDFEEIGELCSVTINKLGRYMLLNVLSRKGLVILS